MTIKTHTEAEHDYKTILLHDFLAVCEEKRLTDDENDREVLTRIAKDLAEKMGHPYQSGLIDEESNNG